MTDIGSWASRRRVTTANRVNNLLESTLLESTLLDTGIGPKYTGRRKKALLRGEPRWTGL